MTVPATVWLRQVAEAAFRDAVAAVQPQQVIAALAPPATWSTGHTIVIAVGKAAPGLAAAWVERHPGWADHLLVVTPHRVPSPEGLDERLVLRGSHPVPDEGGLAAAAALRRLVTPLGPEDSLLVLLSGGASALLAEPIAGVSLATVQAVTRALLNAGAPIEALNTVRRHLLVLSGGGLARLAAPAAVHTAVISDVLTDRLCDIGSGPTVDPPDGPEDARDVLQRWDIDAPEVVRALERLAKPASLTSAQPPVVLANNRTAVAAACASLESAGVQTLMSSRPLTGEAAVLGRVLGALGCALGDHTPSAMVSGAETTVTVRGAGRGGRSQELALAAAGELAGHHGRVVLAAGTDGVDGVSEHAGAIVDGGTAARCERAGVSARVALQRNDSATAIAAAGDALTTGPTGTNVCDLVVVAAAGPRD